MKFQGVASSNDTDMTDPLPTDDQQGTTFRQLFCIYK